MRIILFLAFVVVPIIEISLFLKVGSFIGIPATIGLILLTAIAGTMLVRSQGLEVIQKIRLSAGKGEAPVEALVQGACVLVAGLLLLTPGFATDSIGFALLIPLVRTFLIHKIWKLIEPHVINASVHQTAWHHKSGEAYDDVTIIDGEAEEIRTEPRKSGNRIPDDRLH